MRNKYRLVIFNDDTFEEKVSIILSPINVFTWGGLLFILFIVIIVSVIAFTPIRESIPGYSDVDTRLRATYATLKADSLELAVESRERYISNLRAILKGEPMDMRMIGKKDTTIDYSQMNLGISSEDSLLRKEIEREDKFNIAFQKEKDLDHGISSFFFFTPMRGLITSGFDVSKDHFGVDVVAPKNEAVKATLDGTVIIASWTAENGHVLQLQHEGDIISVYKHNSTLLKESGDFVKAGEAIAIIGESGALSEGPHLHFELWYNGRPIDPQKYMVF